MNVAPIRRALHLEVALVRLPVRSSTTIAFVPLLVVALAVLIPAGMALAWNSTCGEDEACVWRDGPFGLPLAAQGGNDSNYAGDVYPNTSDGLDNSASSIRNLKDTKDVVWFFNGNPPGGTSFCLNSNRESGALNSHNDQYGAHTSVVGSTC